MRRSKRLQIIGINPKHFDRSQIKFFLYLIPVLQIILHTSGF